MSASCRIGGAKIGAELRICAVARCVGLVRECRKAEQRQIDGARQYIEGKPYARLAGDGSEDKPKHESVRDERRERLADGLGGRHDAECTRQTARVSAPA